MRGVGSGIKEFKDAVKEDEKNQKINQNSLIMSFTNTLGISSTNLLKIIILMTN
jgi:Sec-independent protein translocase protein TatA